MTLTVTVEVNGEVLAVAEALRVTPGPNFHASVYTYRATIFHNVGGRMVRTHVEPIQHRYGDGALLLSQRLAKILAKNPAPRVDGADSEPTPGLSVVPVRPLNAVPAGASEE